MKTNRLLKVFFLLLLVAISAILIFRFNLWNIRGVEPSEVYRQWANVKGVQATFINDYQINDTLNMNLTLLQATTDSAWNNLCKAFHSTPTESDNKTIEKGRDILVLCIGFAFEETSMADNDIAVSSLRDRYICIFHDLDDTFKEHILDAIIDKMSFSLKQQQNFYKNEKTN